MPDETANADQAGKPAAKTDILLLYPPWEIKFYQAPGLAQLAGFLLKKNFTVKILDPVALDYSYEKTLEEIKKIDPLIIGVSAPFTGIAKNAVKLLKMIKKQFPEKLLLVGGYYPSMVPKEFAGNCDLVVLGDSADTTASIIERHKNKQDILGLQGIAFQKDGKLIVNEREEETVIDKTVFPAWHLMPIDKYKLDLYLSTGERAFPLQTGWGCPFSCTFCCNSKKKDKKVEFRNLDDVIKEIKHVGKEFGVYGFHIWDETFTLKKDRVVEFCKKVKENKLGIRWSCQTRANLIDKDLVKMMKEAGCVRMSIGVESGDETVLKKIKKNIDLEDALRAIKIINDAGIVSYAGFIIGHPDDTAKSVSRSVEFADRLNPTFVGFRNSIPYPGSVFRDIAEKEGGILTNDWSKYETELVYIAPRLKGYDLKKVQDLAYAFFYWKNFDRIKKVFEKNFDNMFDNTIKYGPEIYLRRKKGEKVSFRELMEKYCKLEKETIKN